MMLGRHSLALRVLAGLVPFALVAAPGCDPPGYAPFDRPLLLREATDMLIVPAYEEAASTGATLHTTTSALCASRSATTLDAAQAAWIAAASAWRGASPFAVGSGPVSTASIDSDLTYPTTPASVDANIAGTDDLQAASYVDALGGPAKGYYSLEYLLFGYPSFTTADDPQTLAALADPRRCTYAEVLAAHIERRTAAARDGWSPSGGNFGAIFASPTATDTYGSGPQGATDELVSAIANALDRVRDSHLGRPLGRTTHAGTVESPYAGASVTLMQAALSGVHSAWTGTPHGLDAFLRSRDAVLAARVVTEIDAAESSIAALQSPPLAQPFELYVGGAEHTAGNTAYTNVGALETSLQTEVATRLGLNVVVMADGD